MAPNLAAFLGGLFTKANAFAQSFAHYQQKLCDAAAAEEQFTLLKVRSTMISYEKSNGGVHSQPYQWLHEILVPPTDAVMHDYLHSPEARAPEPPGMFDDDPEVAGLFTEIAEAEPGFESSMRELDADIRAEYVWPISFQDAVVRLGQIVLPLLEVGNPGSGAAVEVGNLGGGARVEVGDLGSGVDAVVGADVMQERQDGAGGALAPAEASARVVGDRIP